MSRESINAKFVKAGPEFGMEGSGILLRSRQDGLKVLETQMHVLLDGRDPPTSFQGLAELVLAAMSLITANLLHAAASAAREMDDCPPEMAAASMSYSSRLIAEAGAELLSQSVEKFLTNRASPFPSPN